MSHRGSIDRRMESPRDQTVEAAAKEDWLSRSDGKSDTGWPLLSTLWPPPADPWSRQGDQAHACSKLEGLLCGLHDSGGGNEALFRSVLDAVGKEDTWGSAVRFVCQVALGQTEVALQAIVVLHPEVAELNATNPPHPKLQSYPQP